jgi:hypothetical protein
MIRVGIILSEDSITTNIVSDFKIVLHINSPKMLIHLHIRSMRVTQSIDRQQSIRQYK